MLLVGDKTKTNEIFDIEVSFHEAETNHSIECFTRKTNRNQIDPRIKVGKKALTGAYILS